MNTWELLGKYADEEKFIYNTWGNHRSVIYSEINSYFILSEDKKTVNCYLLSEDGEQINNQHYYIDSCINWGDAVESEFTEDELLHKFLNNFSVHELRNELFQLIKTKKHKLELKEKVLKL